MLKHGDIIEKLDVLQKTAIICSALDPAPFAQAGIPAVQKVLLEELGKEEGISYPCAARSWNPALVGEMTEELVLEGAERGGRLFVTPDLKTAVNPYKEGLSEDAFLNGELGGNILRAVRGAGAAAGLARPSLGIGEIEYLDRGEDPAAVHDLVVKPFLQAVGMSPCDAVIMEPTREGTGYYNTNRALLTEVQNGLLGDGVFIVGEGVNSSSDSVALLNGKISLGGAQIPLERAARRYLQLKEYEAEGSVARRELEDSLRDGTAIDGEKIDLILDEIIDFAINLGKLEIHKSSASDRAEPAPVSEPVPAEEPAAAEPASAEEPAAEGEPIPAESGEDTPPAESAAVDMRKTPEEGGDGEKVETVSAAGVRPAAGENFGYPTDIPSFVPIDKRARYRAVAESMVLLKNNRILPLAEGTAVSVLGGGYGDLRAMEEEFRITGKAAGYDPAKSRSDALIPTAVRSTNLSDVTVVFLYPDPAGRELSLPPNRIALLDALKKAKRKVVAVLCGDLPADMSFDYYADAVIAAPADGEFAGDVLAKVLRGKINPSGRLTRTLYDGADAYYKNFRRDRDAGRMNVGAFVGYRRYELENKKTRYPFGFGLSYTKFVYSQLEIGENEISFTLTNAGKVDGCEVAQIYLGAPSVSRVMPKKQLRAFRKVFLRAGESRRITVPFTAADYETFDDSLYAENVETGVYSIYVGSSSLDSSLRGKKAMNGVIRESLNDSNEDYFPDSEYKDEENVKKENRIKKTVDRTPEKLKQLHTAAMFAFPLIAVTFFLLISVLILSYTLNYFILASPVEDAMEWALYIFAVAMLALCPLLGKFNRKRLAGARMASLVATPVLIALCFVFGAIMLTADGGVWERVALRIVTCFAVGTPILAVVATVIERQLWKSKSGANRWDRYYFTRAQVEKTTGDREFEEEFRKAEARTVKKETKEEKFVPAEEVVSFYDKSLTCAQMADDCRKFAAERGLAVDQSVMRNWMAAVFSARLIIVPSGCGAELCEIVAGYFGKKAYIDNGAGYRKYEDLFTQWRQSGNANFPTNLSIATETARRESAYLHTVLIRHMNRLFMESVLLPVAEVLCRKKSALPPAGGKTYELPRNLIIVAEAEGEGLKDLPASIAAVAAGLSPAAEKCESAPYKTMLQAVGYERLDAMRQNIRDEYSIDEDLWKKADALNERIKTARIDNRMWKKLETHTAFITACGGSGEEALDGALAVEFMPWLSAVWDEKAAGKLPKALSEVFGEVEMGGCMAFAEGGEEEK